MISNHPNKLHPLMKDLEKEYDYDINKKIEYSFKSSKVDFTLPKKRELKLDIKLKEINMIRVFGKIVYKDKKEVKNKKVILYALTFLNFKTEYIPISEGMTDRFGNYDFIIDSSFKDSRLKIEIEN